jgi:hypothetical protein
MARRISLLFIALAAAAAIIGDGHHWSHRHINGYTLEIFGPASGSDAERVRVAARLCPKTGWESDSAVTFIKGGRQLKWRIVCRPR